MAFIPIPHSAFHICTRSGGSLSRGYDRRRTRLDLFRRFCHTPAPLLNLSISAAAIAPMDGS